MSVCMDILRGKMAERRVTNEEMAQRIGVDVSTFYRKMKSEGTSFTVGQMHKIVDVLSLTREEASSIFCGETRNNASDVRIWKEQGGKRC